MPRPRARRTDDFAHKLYYRESDFTVVDRITARSRRHAGVKNAQIALAWILAKPGVSAPIIGASKPYQLEDALGCVGVEAIR